MKNLLFVALLILFVASLTFAQAEFDVVIRGGTVYDGSGGKPVKTDVGIKGDKVTKVGNLSRAKAATVIDATGMAVAPGFINMLSWSTESLIVDPRSLGDLKQGVTTQIFGEGWSMGPLNDRMKKQMKDDQGDLKYDIEWTTLSDYLNYFEKRGVSQNVASYIGATTIRMYVLGEGDVQPNAEQLQQMRDLVEKEMRAGALGIGTSLIYAPAFYAKTEEIIELCKVAAKYQGKYISHMRSEGARLEEAVDELIRISREANIPAEIYHLKAGGAENWPKMDKVLAKVKAARKSGMKITADMYNYPAGATGLDASMPPWVLDGGYSEQLYKRIQDPATRKRIIEEMRTPTDKWENLRLAAGSPDKVILVGFKNDKLKPLTGKTLAAIAKERGKSPEETAMDLVVEDGSRIQCIYFTMTEDNLRKQVVQPYMSFASDAGAPAPEGVFLKENPHPRTYGTFARLLAKYVREEHLVTLPDAIHRLTGLPASNLRLEKRGELSPGYYADIVVFDPATIQDHATFEQPHQLATGVRQVFINGVQVLKDGEHTGATPGRVVKGPGARL